LVQILLVNTAQSDFWHDTVFQLVVIAIVTIVSGAIGGVTTYWIYRKQRTKKEISYRIISNALVASVDADMIGRIEIRFDGKQVHGLRLLVLDLWNSGCHPETCVKVCRKQAGMRASCVYSVHMV
jgi:hypothetical protein